MNDPQRFEQRQSSTEHISVEFQPPKASLPYHFRVRDYSSHGLGILVKEDSVVLDMIQVGDILDMKYYDGEDSPTPVNVRTKIQHISLPANGAPRNHFIVGLNILNFESTMDTDL